MVYGLLEDVKASILRPTNRTSEDDERIRDVLDHEVSKYVQVLSAINYAESLRQNLVRYGSDDYIRGLLEREHHQAAAPDIAEKWNEQFPPKLLDESLNAYTQNSVADESKKQFARELLSCLLARRADQARRHSNLLRIRAAVLFMMMVVLIALAVGLWWAVGSAPQVGATKAQLALLAAFAGAAGSTINITRSFRDSIGGLENFTAVLAAVLIQPFLGACIGIGVLLILFSGLAGAFGVTGGDKIPWATVGALALAGGLSEPFFIGLVDRIVSATQTKPPSVKAGSA